MLFVDYSSAFNTIIPDILITKLITLGLPPLTCAWIKDFLTNRPQTVRLGPHLSSTRTLSTGSPQGCVLSPLLYCLYTHDCSPANNSNLIVKFADDTTVVGIISGGDEAAYREEVLKLVAWCSENNLALNTRKTKEIIINFRKLSTDPPPTPHQRVHTFRFLGVLISSDLTWTENTTAIIKKAQQRLHFLRVLRKYNLNSSLLLAFYRSSIESILTYCITVWYSSCTMADRERLQRIIKAAQKIIGCPLPSLTDIFTSRCLTRAKNITKDNTHPGFILFDLLPSRRRYSGPGHVIRCRDGGPEQVSDDVYAPAVVSGDVEPSAARMPSSPWVESSGGTPLWSPGRDGGASAAGAIPWTADGEVRPSMDGPVGRPGMVKTAARTWVVCVGADPPAVTVDARLSSVEMEWRRRLP
ncbi:putative RNA-directed DNA polymerase from transposon X-element [Merluccius polli]|uniref:RNA-directed DNA polymerase from transposon X-element n=1 Tax=Merluccius polli TaxID=89951 RepID=A0AA47N7V1_MERPO|nr:putative RNA-directed DNA polymerase from transposon X-element [Merluccius polli]